jgi:hypothetical protein
MLTGTGSSATVSRALEKLPADRFATAHDFADALADPSFRHGQAVGAVPGPDGRIWRRVAAVLALAIVVLAGAWAWTLTGGDGGEPVRRNRMAGLAENHRTLGSRSVPWVRALSTMGRTVGAGIAGGTI